MGGSGWMLKLVVMAILLINIRLTKAWKCKKAEKFREDAKMLEDIDEAMAILETGNFDMMEGQMADAMMMGGGMVGGYDPMMAGGMDPMMMGGGMDPMMMGGGMD